MAKRPPREPRPWPLLLLFSLLSLSRTRPADGSRELTRSPPFVPSLIFLPNHSFLSLNSAQFLESTAKDRPGRRGGGRSRSSRLGSPTPTNWLSAAVARARSLSPRLLRPRRPKDGGKEK